MKKLIPMFDSEYSWTGYGTDGQATLEGCESIKIGTPNDMDRYSPPTLLLMAAEGCFASHVIKDSKAGGLVLLDYESSAEGFMSGSPKDGFQFGKVVISVIITLKSNEDESKAKEIVEQAQKDCLVARSLACPVEITAEYRYFPEIQ